MIDGHLIFSFLFIAIPSLSVFVSSSTVMDTTTTTTTSSYSGRMDNDISVSESMSALGSVASMDVGAHPNTMQMNPAPEQCSPSLQQFNCVNSSGEPAPYIRNSLARAVYMKMKEDENNKNDRHVYWYRVIVSRLSPDLQNKFIQFEQDEATEEFLTHCVDLSNEVFTQLFHTVAKAFLKLFMTQTSINGYLQRGSMFIFSPSHVEKLLGLSAFHKAENLLDLGAGDGKVTQVLSSYYRNTYATEMSTVMVKRLQALGFSVLGIDDWQNREVKYDLISCLNLLDRCDKPIQLLADMRSSLAPDGRILLAVVIPFKPYVEFESVTHEPSELIRVKGTNFEEEIQQFSNLFDQSGFTVESFTRLPYLCEGDLHHSYYVLSDAVFVLKRRET